MSAPEITILLTAVSGAYILGRCAGYASAFRETEEEKRKIEEALKAERENACLPEEEE
jgi:hypothetical protein